MLGWHAEGPFLQMAKRGAHAVPFLLTAPQGFQSLESLYGADNLADAEDWLMKDNVVGGEEVGVRIITAAPELDGVGASVKELTKRQVVFSIGHRFVCLPLISLLCLKQKIDPHSRYTA